MKHFDTIVFGGIVADSATGDEAESSEMELGTEDDLSDGSMPLGSPQDPLTPESPHREESPHMLSHSTEQFRAMTITTTSGTHYPPIDIQRAPDVISHGSHPPALATSHPATSSFRQSISMSSSSSRQRLAPTPSFSAPPPPIIEPEPQPILDDSVPLADSSSMEEAVIHPVITQHQATAKGSGKARAKKVTQKRADALPRRSTRTGPSKV